MYDPDIHHRRSLRWHHYDYSQAGLYFVTLCIQDRAPLLGTVADGALVASPAGHMVRHAWEELPAQCPGVAADAFIVMPNHLHGLLVLSADIPGERLSLADVVRRFKTWTTTLYGRGVRQENWPAYNGRLWQRNYFERVVRTETEWRAYRDYIANNPANAEDTLPPDI